MKQRRDRKRDRDREQRGQREQREQREQRDEAVTPSFIQTNAGLFAAFHM